MYDSDRGYLSFGSKSMDRFAFNSYWNAVIGVPKALAVALPMYYALCLSSAFPVGGLSAAIGIQTLNQFISAGFYFDKRYKYIKQ